VSHRGIVANRAGDVVYNLGHTVRVGREGGLNRGGRPTGLRPQGRGGKDQKENFLPGNLKGGTGGAGVYALSPCYLLQGFFGNLGGTAGNLQEGETAGEPRRRFGLIERRNKNPLVGACLTRAPERGKIKAVPRSGVQRRKRKKDLLLVT